MLQDIKGVKWTLPKDSASFSGEGELVSVVHKIVVSSWVEVQVCGPLSLEANSGCKSCVWCHVHKAVDWTVMVC